MKFTRTLNRTTLVQLLDDGYTQKQIAEMYGLTQPEISRMKNGKTKALKVRRVPHGIDSMLERLWARED